MKVPGSKQYNFQIDEKEGIKTHDGQRDRKKMPIWSELVRVS